MKFKNEYNKLWIKWIVAGAIVILLTLLPMVLVFDHDTGQKIAIGYIVVILIVGLLGWIHFRMDTFKIRMKRKQVMEDEDIAFYGFKPGTLEEELKARKRKVTIFVLTLIIWIVLALLIGLPAIIL